MKIYFNLSLQMMVLMFSFANFVVHELFRLVLYDYRLSKNKFVIIQLISFIYHVILNTR